MPPVVSAHNARTLLLAGQGLLDDPARRAGPVATQRVVDQLGYVQLDSINVLARAHDLTLAARLDGYEPRHLCALLEKKRSLFEHWTHDASAIPAELLPHWRPRFDAWAHYDEKRAPARARMGPEPDRVIRSVMSRIRREGPLMSRDFEQERFAHAPRIGGFWNWGFQKAALEFLWRTGRLVICERRNFQKVYDLRERVFPDLHFGGGSRTRFVDWACEAALERIGVGSPAEIAHFWGGVRAPEATRWCESAVRKGRVEEVALEAADGSKPRRGYAIADWRERVEGAPDPPDRARLLSPFDPVVRDRARLTRLFGFDYRIEVFVPAAKRRYGYYVLPILEGERLIGRLDPKLDRDNGVLRVRKMWWEPGVRPTRDLKRRVGEAARRTARLVGARDLVLPKSLQ